MYANNNPVVFIDPDGMDFTAVGKDAQELFSAFQKAMVNNSNSNETDPPNNRKAGSTPKGMSEAESLSQLITIGGKKYHKNTSNIFAQAGNSINSFFGGADDYFVEHKEYDKADDSFIHEAFEQSAGGLVGFGLGKAIGSLLSTNASKIGIGMADDFLASANKKWGEQGLTVIGRALQKHAGREGSVFQGIKFSHKTANQDAMGVLNQIVNSSNKTIQQAKGGGYHIFDKTTGRGFGVSREGLFNGFRELQK